MSVGVLPETCPPRRSLAIPHGRCHPPSAVSTFLATAAASVSPTFRLFAPGIPRLTLGCGSFVNVSARGRDVHAAPSVEKTRCIERSLQKKFQYPKISDRNKGNQPDAQDLRPRTSPWKTYFQQVTHSLSLLRDPTLCFHQLPHSFRKNRGVYPPRVNTHARITVSSPTPLLSRSFSLLPLFSPLLLFRFSNFWALCKNRGVG